jgi:hypothetical protein
MELLKQIGAPGSITLFVICFALLTLAWWLRPRWAATLQAGLLALCGAYVVLSLPVVASAITDRLPPVPSAVSSAAPGQVDLLVVLDGDNVRGRARAGIEVNRAAAPREVWVLGNGWMVEALSWGGVPRYRIFHDAFLATTRDQVASLERLVAKRRGARIAVIVSRLQAPRMAGLLEAADLSTVALIPSPADVEPATTGVRRFVPTYYALRISRDALYELAALRYYRWKGWIR